MPDYITIIESGSLGISTIATNLSTTSVAVAVGFIGATGPIGSGFDLSGPNNGLITRNGLEGNVVVAEAGFTYDPNGTGYLSGKFGINKTNPTFTLDVAGSGNFSSGVYSSGNLVVTGSVVRPAETGVFATAVNLASTGSTLTNSITSLSGTLTGDYVRLNESRLTVTSSSVSIGTATSTTLLTVGGSGSVTAASGLSFGNDSGTNLYRSSASTIKTDGSFLALGSGNFSSGVYSSGNLVVTGSVVRPTETGVFATAVSLASTGSTLTNSITSLSGTLTGNYVRLNESRPAVTSSSVSIGTTTSTMLLTVGGSGSVTAASGLSFGNDSSSNLYRSAASTIKTDGSFTVAQNLTVTNHLSAVTKSFLIDHPSEKGKMLQYGSLESPYHGIRLTGKSKLISDSIIINLPSYVSNLVGEEGVNIQITNINHDEVLYVKQINIKENHFIVGVSCLPSSGCEFYWSFTAIRKDVPPLEVEYQLKYG